jgi:hypothetical protein
LPTASDLTLLRDTWRVFTSASTLGIADLSLPTDLKTSGGADVVKLPGRVAISDVNEKLFDKAEDSGVYSTETYIDYFLI